jgi:hypothetical protein
MFEYHTNLVRDVSALSGSLSHCGISHKGTFSPACVNESFLHEIVQDPPGSDFAYFVPLGYLAQRGNPIMRPQAAFKDLDRKIRLDTGVFVSLFVGFRFLYHVSLPTFLEFYGN